MSEQAIPPGAVAGIWFKMDRETFGPLIWRISQEDSLNSLTRALRRDYPGAEITKVTINPEPKEGGQV